MKRSHSWPAAIHLAACPCSHRTLFNPVSCSCAPLTLVVQLDMLNVMSYDAGSLTDPASNPTGYDPKASALNSLPPQHGRQRTVLSPSPLRLHRS